MVGKSGGISAAFGFRYQYLVTIEEILNLYINSRNSQWRVDVDSYGQDSADILVYENSILSKAIQVKASMQSSSTTMNLPFAQKCLDALSSEHPNATQFILRTNRKLDKTTQTYAQTLTNGKTKKHIDFRNEGKRDIAKNLITKIAEIRRRGVGGLGDNIYRIILAELVDLVQDKGSQTSNQSIDYSQVSHILDASPAVLAKAQGIRSWGRTFGMPTGSYIHRSKIEDFLSQELPNESLVEEVPRTAVLWGLPGTGKTIAASTWAQTRRAHYSFSLLLDASFEKRLTEQIPQILESTGPRLITNSDMAQEFKDAFSDMALPWLLIFDNVSDYDTIKNWIPTSGYGHIIITTNRNWPNDISPSLELGDLAPNDELALIKRRLPSQTTMNNDADLLKFASVLGHWPLAIEVACAWIRLRGGDYAHINRFIPEIRKMNVISGKQHLGNYTKDISNIVEKLEETLSPDSKDVLTLMIFSRGTEIPITIFQDWAALVNAKTGQKINMETILDELTEKALITRRPLLNSEDETMVHEVAYVHNGIQAVLSAKETGISIPLVYGLFLTYDSTFKRLTEEAKSNEALALFPAITTFLKSLIQGRPETETGPDVETFQYLLFIATSTMHNLGEFAAIMISVDTACDWLSIATNLREQLTSDEQRKQPAFIATQIQTLAQLAQFNFYRKNDEQLQVVFDWLFNYLDGQTLTYLESTGISMVTTLQAIQNIPEQTSQSSTKLHTLIKKILHNCESVPAEESPLQNTLNQSSYSEQLAEAYADQEQWSVAVDIIIREANHTAGTGLLKYNVIETILNIEISMMASKLSRPFAFLPDWDESFERLLEWSESNIDSFNSSQQIRTSIFKAFFAGNVQQMQSSLNDLTQTSMNPQQIYAYKKLIQYAIEILKKQHLAKIVTNNQPLPPNIEIIRAVNGGEDLKCWNFIIGDEPIFIFANVSIIKYVGTEETDPFLERIISNGFPDKLDASNNPKQAKGWKAVITTEEIRLLQPDGTPVATENLSGDNSESSYQWLQAVKHRKQLRVIYRDAANLSPADILSTKTQGIIQISKPNRLGQWIHRIHSKLSNDTERKHQRTRH